MTVAVAYCDDAHKQLIDLIGQLNDAMNNGRGEKVIVGILTSLSTYCQEHFTKEEHILEQQGYPQFKEHKQIHDTFMRKVTESIEGLKNHTVSPASIMNLLSDWLMLHILKVDKR